MISTWQKPGYFDPKETKHEGLRYVCDICFHSVCSQLSLKRHKQSVHEGISYACDQCEYVTRHKYALNRHNEAKHGSSDTSRIPDKNLKMEETIDKSANNPKVEEMDSFMSNNYDNIEQRTDEILINGIMEKSEAVLDIKQELDPGEISPAEICDQIIKLESPEDYVEDASFLNVAIEEEDQVSFDDIKFECEQCDFAGSSGCQLKEHRESKHGGILYPCGQCHYVATLQHNLTRHKKAKHPTPRNDQILEPFIKAEPQDNCTEDISDHNDSIENSQKLSNEKIKRRKKDKNPISRNKRKNKLHENISPAEHSKSVIKTEKDQNSSNVRKEEFKHKCDQCDTAYKKISHLKDHKAAKHSGISYPCEHCDYTANLLHNLKRHVKSKHEGSKYPCDLCSYVAGYPAHLKLHKETQHSGVQYSCDQCKYAINCPKKLRRHTLNVHSGRAFNCARCAYVTTRMVYLKRHIRKMHVASKGKSELGSETEEFEDMNSEEDLVNPLIICEQGLDEEEIKEEMIEEDFHNFDQGQTLDF